MITLFQKLFRYLLTGTIFLLPFVITVGAVAWLGLFIAQYLGPSTFVGKWLAKIGLFSFQTNYPLLSYIIGLLTVLAIIMAVGWIIERRWVKTCVELLNELIKKIPIIGAFYDAVCQLVSTLDKSKFKQMTPAYCRLGSTMVLALLTTLDKITIDGKSYYSAIIPTAPVPFGGAVLIVPEEDVIFPEPNIPFEPFCKYYTSLGMIGLEKTYQQGVPPKQDIPNDANAQSAEEKLNA